EEPGPADGAEAAARAVVLVPVQVLRALHLELLPGARRELRRRSVRPPAHAAVADDHLTQRPFDAVADGAAQTATPMHLCHPGRVEGQAARRSTARSRFIASSAATLYDSAS